MSTPTSRKIMHIASHQVTYPLIYIILALALSLLVDQKILSR